MIDYILLGGEFLKTHNSKYSSFLTYFLILSLTLFLTSCSSYHSLIETAQSITSRIKTEFQDTSDYKFDEKVYVLERHETLILDTGFPIPSDYSSYVMFEFFLDPELKIPLWTPNPKYTPDDTTVEITPNYCPLFHTELDDIPNTDWGNLGTLYLAKYFDEEGNLTDTPYSVSIIKIKTELSQPIVQLSTDEKGYAMLSWQPVDGATQYSVYSISLCDNQITSDETLMLLGTTTDTYFKDFNYFTFDMSDDTGVDTNDIIAINVDFELNDSIYGNGFVVIAEGPAGKSEMSQLIRPCDYASLLPCSPDYEAMDTDDFLLSYNYPIKMCDGSTVYYDVVYDLDTLSEYKGNTEIPEDFTNAGKKLMTILGRIQGTPFEDVFYFVCYHETETPQEAFERVLSSLAQIIKPSAGLNTPTSITTVIDDTQLPSTHNVTSFDLDSRISITATNPLSKYLAYNLLLGNEDISLEDFPEATDSSYLLDAYFEAFYQNPLITNVDTLYFNPYTNHLIVTYTASPEELHDQQQQLLDTASDIIDTLITTDMSDLDKESAINDYLCDTITYDTDALESAKANNYTGCDPIYNDSFTAYGALLNHVCVCQGYAQAFKLLADMASLDSIVVTGTSSGIGHAWNKVNICGNWLTLDVTTNDSDVIPNSIFNLPEEALTSIYITDDKYLLNDHLNDFPNSDCLDYEYYHLIDCYYEKDEVASIISSKLLSSIDLF